MRCFHEHPHDPCIRTGVLTQGIGTPIQRKILLDWFPSQFTSMSCSGPYCQTGKNISFWIPLDKKPFGGQPHLANQGRGELHRCDVVACKEGPGCRCLRRSQPFPPSPSCSWLCSEVFWCCPATCGDRFTTV